jgi:hypothetical protein
VHIWPSAAGAVQEPFWMCAAPTGSFMELLMVRAFACTASVSG